MTKYKWFLFTNENCLSVEQYLNGLAQKGWALQTEQDGCKAFARFERTKRKELCYFVEPAPILREEQRLAKDVESRKRYGWEAVGTINGMDIYQSSPCQQTTKPERRKQNKTAVFFMLVSLCLAGLFCGQALRSADAWYLGNLSAYLTLTKDALFCSWLLWIALHLLSGQLEKIRMWVGSALTALFSVWVLLLPVCMLLDWLPIAWACGVLLLTLLALLLLRNQFKQRKKEMTLLVLGVMLVTGLALNQVLPATQECYHIGSAPWRMYLTDIITAESLDTTTGDFVSAEYHKTGSILVQKSVYSERWKALRLECENYACLTQTLAELVEKDMVIQHPNWSISREGNTVQCLWVSEKN